MSNISLSKETLQVCGFRIGDGNYAVPVLDVQEVIKPQKVTPIPLAPETIRGLINLRGQIVTAISLRKLFGLKDDLTQDHMNVIVKSGEHLCALVVDEILDVIDVDQNTFEQTPSTINENLKKYIKGIYKLNGNLLILLDIKEIVKF
jgi:purine-binding chemotaxis protein CheW